MQLSEIRQLHAPRLVPGNRLALLVGGREYFPALIAAIDGALREIYLESYIFADDEIGRSVANALIRAAARGVAVHLLLDGFGSRALRPAFLRRLQDAGVAVLKYRPRILFWHRHSLRRLHRKLVVIDTRVAFVGGINIVNDNGPAGEGAPTLDYAVTVEGPLLAGIHRSARKLWGLVSWVHFRIRGLRLSADIAPPAACGTQRAAFVIRDNLRHRRAIEHAYHGAIAHARNDIVLATAYFLPRITFCTALCAAARRGVRVWLLLQGRTDHALIHHATRALYGRLLEAGVEIYEYRHGFLHAKVAVVDRTWITVGSSNIDPFSLLLAREANVIAEDAALAAQLYASLNEAIAVAAQRIRSEDLRREPLWRRLTAWAGYGLVRLLIGILGYAR